MAVLCKTGWHPVGRQIGSLVTWVNRPFSRGRVTLGVPAPEAEPRVEFALLADARDARRLMIAFRTAASLFATDALRQVANDPFPPATASASAISASCLARTWCSPPSSPAVWMGRPRFAARCSGVSSPRVRRSTACSPTRSCWRRSSEPAFTASGTHRAPAAWGDRVIPMRWWMRLGGSSGSRVSGLRTPR